MPFVTYINAIPATNNNPSVDQPDMATNTDAVDTIIAVDHISFNDNQGGLHQQVTFNNKNTQGAQTDPQSVLYTRSGTASTVADMAYRNQNGVFLPNLIRAAAICDSAGNVVGGQSYNISSVVRNSTGQFTVTTTSNSTNGTSFMVLVSQNMAAAPTNVSIESGYAILGANSFQLNFRLSTLVNISPTDPANFSFIVLQV